MSMRLDAVLWDRARHGMENCAHTPTSATRDLLRSGSLRVSVKTCLKQIDENCEIPTIDKLPQETMRMPTSFENTPANLHAFVSVTVHGSKDITKVPLPTRFRKTTDPTTPTTSGSFYKYMSETLNVNVTAVYYPVRGDHAVRGGQGSSVLKRFVEDSGPTQYPFVGGMRLVLCLNGDELRDEELFLQSGAPCQGAGCCVM